MSGTASFCVGGTTEQESFAFAFPHCVHLPQEMKTRKRRRQCMRYCNHNAGSSAQSKTANLGGLHELLQAILGGHDCTEQDSEVRSSAPSYYTYWALEVALKATP